MSRSKRQRAELAFDVAVALVVFALSLGMLAGGSDRVDEHGGRPIDGGGVVLAALASLPLVARRRAPLAVFAFTGAASALLQALGYPQGPPLGPTVALFFVALSGDESRERTRLTIGTIVGIFVLHLTAAGVGEGELPGIELVLGATLWSAAWFAGDRTRLRRERIRALEERAERAEREAERERRLAAAEERTRIARDLHDSAGHAINVILVQAGAARMLQERDPDAARAALSTIEDVARDTIGEIDQLVRVLRDDGGDDEVEPPPGLAALDRLVDRHRASGLDVELAVTGRRQQLSPAVDRAAFRILQEALTNAARHGRGSARVQIDYGAGELELVVENPTTAAATTGTGHGLVGMQERATLLGGTLVAGPSNGRFRVSARLPYAEERA